MKRYMILLNANGKCRLIECDKDGTLTLQAMQVLVDGPIEVTKSTLGPCWAREPVDCINLIVNEEGMLRQLPYNESATELYEYSDKDVILGDALLAAARFDDLIGFSEHVCRTLVQEYSLKMEDEKWKA